ncbi:hypothetical protein Palpr_2375 [Paludibacter propionicigenes WB4]|uniref:Uncharacterized protein n=1 Tax=Paludibacter propionicigenes (strain DSM 17365 / JCM 13257 / WB4) TaxID=694427 RepID=E4T714_PALPW|nr:hypothetical protein [Paludibacter propionicigenes]ADQ80508.1 hypothetical protein Palpr_2375 [Paludibacter propionicigenes WB4]
MRQLMLTVIVFLTTVISGQTKQELTNFVPKGFVISEKITGDLNKDGLTDCVLIIKGTDKKMIVKNRNSEEVDRNRRGIIILLNKNNSFELTTKNYNCFSSENEDGGVYFAPELYIEIIKGNLSIHYGHGRYGFWRYTFRLKDSYFELIGYDSSDNRGPVVNRETSINFLSKKKKIRENTNQNVSAESEEVFKETWEKVQLDKLIKLSEIIDFDELDLENN